MKKTLYLLLGMIAFFSGNEVCAAKEKTFYDAKSQMIGVSGDVDLLIKSGFENKMFINDVPIEIELPESTKNQKKKKKWSDEQIIEITSKLNRQRVGHKILASLFPYKTNADGSISLSDSVMNARALANAQLADVEKASIGMLDSTSILRDDWEPILKNNYIFLVKKNSSLFSSLSDLMTGSMTGSITNPESGYADFIVFKVDITDEIIHQVFQNWDNPTGFEAIDVNLICVCCDARDSYIEINRILSKEVPAFAIRGQLISRNPAKANIGSSDGLKKGDLVSLYRQKMDKDGKLYSQRVSRARVCDVEEESSRMFFVSGSKGSYKAGDVVVYTPDRGKGLGIYANFNSGNFFGASVSWDINMHVSKSGLTSYWLTQLKVVTNGYYHDYPIVVDLKPIGYGLSWTLLGRFEAMPFFNAGFEYVRNDSENQVGVVLSGGLRFDVNIAYPVKFSCGAEYESVIGLDLSDKIDSFSNYDLSHRNGVNVFAGIRWVF